MSQSPGLRLPGPLLMRFAVWAAMLCVFPLPGSVLAYSFRVEVLGQAPKLEAPLAQVVSPAHFGAAPIEEPSVELSDRVLIRLVEAEARETDAWLRDDYRIARVTVRLARTGSPIPHVEATYMVLGAHPDQVWPRIVAERHARLGAEYDSFFGPASSPKKPVQSVKRARKNFGRQSNVA